MQAVSAPIIGSHLGQPIYQKLKQDGVTYVFDRIAECDDDGWYHLTQLAPKELLLKNGLIYKRPAA